MQTQHGLQGLHPDLRVGAGLERLGQLAQLLRREVRSATPRRRRQRSNFELREAPKTTIIHTQSKCQQDTQTTHGRLQSLFVLADVISCTSRGQLYVHKAKSCAVETQTHRLLCMLRGTGHGHWQPQVCDSCSIDGVGRL